MPTRLSRPRGAGQLRRGRRARGPRARSCSRQALPDRTHARTPPPPEPGPLVCRVRAHLLGWLADAAHPRQAPSRCPRMVSPQLSPERRADGHARRHTSRSSLQPARDGTGGRTPSSHGPRRGCVRGGRHGHPRSPGACTPISHSGNLLDNAPRMNFLSFSASSTLPGVTPKYTTHPRTRVSETASEGTHLRWSHQMLQTSS